MCGISGIWNFGKGPVPGQTIKRFNDAIAHRGPDGEGFFHDDTQGLALGHRRLSILDLSDAGHQPMKRGRYVISFNGEVYNFIELRDELIKAGHQFVSDCDTEVILAAWEQWGMDALSRFNGMWAFAIWDQLTEQLILCRDRYGVKPLYYYYAPGQMLAFCSETVAFKHLDGLNRIINEKHLTRGLQNVYDLESHDQTIFQGIKKLHAGSLAIIDRSGDFTVTQWWKTEQNHVTVPERYEEQTERFRNIFQDACALRLRSDVPLATALSGGLDSSSVYCQVKKLMGSDLLNRTPEDSQRAVVATFPGTSMDERHYAQDVINYTKGEGIFVEPDLTDLAFQISEQVKKEDFVYASPPIVHNIYKAMKQNGISVSMDGHGVDEMIYGYPFDVLNAFRMTPDYQRKLEILNIYSGLTNQPLSQLRKTHLDRKLLNAVKSRLQKKLTRTRKAEPWLNHEQSALDASFDRFESEDPFYNIPYQLFHQSSMPTLLRNWDSASSQHGVEIRMPFMDYRLVSFVFSLPFESKVGGNFSKRILRDSMKGILPESIRTRTYKIGINAPMPEWFAGPLKPMILDIVNSKSFLQSSVWAGSQIRKQVEQVAAKGEWDLDLCYKLWPIINAWLIIEN